ncbi:MAG: DNA repair protein RecO [Candidatus Aureabacteria bacterium]|nr:DNA repair protein RecO [Candidatus Auribacterota bacterium]
MIRSAQGVILRSREVTETSLALTVVTDRAGRLSLLAKGARRKRSPFLGRVELFSRCHLTYYDNPRRGVNILSECEIINPFAAIREQYGLFTAACYFAELVENVTLPESAAGGVFDLLCETLEILPAFPDPLLLRRYFELGMLTHTGFSLRLDACVRCAAHKGLCFFSDAAGGALCAACGKDRPRALRISPGALALLKTLQASPLALAARLSVPGRQAAELRDVLGRAILFHFDRLPKGRDGG